MLSRSGLTRALALVALVMSLALSACGDKPSEKDCKALLDKIIDFEIAAAGTSGLSAEEKADLDKQRKQLEEYLQKPFMKQCMDSTPTAVIACGLAAKTEKDYAACETR